MGFERILCRFRSGLYWENWARVAFRKWLGAKRISEEFGTTQKNVEG